MDAKTTPRLAGSLFGAIRSATRIVPLDDPSPGELLGKFRDWYGSLWSDIAYGREIDVGSQLDIPPGCVGLGLNLSMRDTGTLGTVNLYVMVGPKAITNTEVLICRTPGGNLLNDVWGLVFFDLGVQQPTLYIGVGASGSDTAQIYIRATHLLF